ncbi:MAG: tyrosine-protein phosphatase [Bacteroidales bacterium]|nr:tyrosine-protein phosphatase [Bacteroidales bacterium]
MKKTMLSSACILFFSLLLSCGGNEAILPPSPHGKQAVVDSTQTPVVPDVPDKPDTTEIPEVPETPETPEEIPEDAILVTNPLMEAYLSEVTYPEGDWTYSKILDYPGGGFEGVGDLPPTVTLSWTESASGALTLTLKEGDWSREYSVASGKKSCDVTNLVPNRKYEWVVTTSDGTVVASDSFWTKGHLHQIFYTKQVRNGRDLGGWQTKDGKTVKYRMVYRSGKPCENYADAAGIKNMRADGIKAQIDLREKSDSHDQSSPMGNDIDFFCSDIEHSYKTMLEEKAKVKATFEFLMKSLRAGKPVLFHCAIGSDRTGTFSILLLGLLGVPEPDICKEYEITYFAPEKWSVTNGKVDRLRTNKSRYLQAINYLLQFGSYKDFRGCVEKYFLSIGVSQKDLDDFRTLMLE